MEKLDQHICREPGQKSIKCGLYDNDNDLGVADRIEGWGDASFPSFEEGRRIQRARAGDRGPNMGNWLTPRRETKTHRGHTIHSLRPSPPRRARGQTNICLRILPTGLFVTCLRCCAMHIFALWRDMYPEWQKLAGFRDQASKIPSVFCWARASITRVEVFVKYVYHLQCINAKKSKETRPSKLCESQIPWDHEYIWKMFTPKNITLEKYSSLKTSRP